MLIALMAKDNTGALQTRIDNRDAHIAYLKDSGVVSQAGPFLDEGGEMIGSLVILDVPDMAAAEQWAENDPYARAGLFSEVRMIAWKKVI
ncbi:YciI family protein [Pseudohalocynthiibacter aestuariivivens]|uniref:YciI family protein n=1 Tax=Roseovarius pelagicus TaxID=2980108 RepID=A0ABY6D974_9RHOB|nr:MULTISPECIES: YciI family protein [Rhodobacterales]QIE45394.1 YciI family protein [Pseudohalocynthiibacter aestuariivivens]UXX82686.1 YciI family protein [Roseovarius pelagicus]